MAQARTQPHVLVTVCHHAGDLVLDCLKSLEVAHRNGITVQVVVATSTDRIFGGVTTLRHGGGPAEKRNVAVAAYGAKADYLVFLDDDATVSPYTLLEMEKCMREHPTCGMGFIKIYKADRRDVFDDCGSWLTPTGFLWARAGNSQRDVGQYEDSCRVLASKSATCIVRRSVFFNSGGFDADYYILGEETDLAWRIWLLGWECWYFPTALAWHAFDTPLKPKGKYYTDERIFYRGCKNYLSLLLTNLGTLRLCMIVPIHLMAWFASIVGFLVVGQPRRSGLICKAMWHTITCTSGWPAKRRKVQTARVVSDRSLWPSIARTPGFGYYLGRLLRYVGQGYHG